MFHAFSMFAFSRCRIFRFRVFSVPASGDLYERVIWRHTRPGWLTRCRNCVSSDLVTTGGHSGTLTSRPGWDNWSLRTDRQTDTK